MKKRNRGALRFQQKTSRPPLTREQCSYLLEHLPKILKIGTEFEINLPEPTAPLQEKDSEACVHADKPCVEDCVNLETCLTTRHPAFCLTRSTGKFLGEDFQCPAKDETDSEACKTCPAWMLNCRGLSCSMHTPYCTVCPSFQRRGRTVEKADIRRDPESVRREMRDLLTPTGTLGQVGASGVLEVKKDNSLMYNGGIEVPTVGRRIHWNSFYNMCKNIIDPIVENGGFVNERCGQHYHVLAGYFQGPEKISDLEEPLPEIVLANLHQLHRRYELAMFWIMSAGASMESLTRWARFRQSIFRFSAVRSKMSRVQRELAQNIICMGGAPQNGKYASVAYHFCEFDGKGDVETFHIENRIADGCLSPAVAASWAMLCYALVMKAVRLSQYGIMEVGDQEFTERVKQTAPHIIDGEHREWGGGRFADTSGIGPFIPFLRETAREMVQLLKPELTNLGPSFNILMELAERPCSVRLVEGQSWEDIERDLYGDYAREEPPGRGDNEEEVLEIIDLAGIVECEDVESWIEEVAANLGQDPNDVAQTVNELIGSGHYRWSDAIGALITT
ncbi:MAG: hypothetical protein GF334_03730 [Candidatus Altiarchaeales archaeon]|nr:hypothetical protein [Candidatus Altiarchaeales archaeon]